MITVFIPRYLYTAVTVLRSTWGLVVVAVSLPHSPQLGFPSPVKGFSNCWPSRHKLSSLSECRGKTHSKDWLPRSQQHSPGSGYKGRQGLPEQVLFTLNIWSRCASYCSVLCLVMSLFVPVEEEIIVSCYFLAAVLTKRWCTCPLVWTRLYI